MGLKNTLLAGVVTGAILFGLGNASAEVNSSYSNPYVNTYQQSMSSENSMSVEKYKQEVLNNMEAAYRAFNNIKKQVVLAYKHRKNDDLYIENVSHIERLMHIMESKNRKAQVNYLAYLSWRHNSNPLDDEGNKYRLGIYEDIKFLREVMRLYVVALHSIVVGDEVKLNASTAELERMFGTKDLVKILKEINTFYAGLKEDIASEGKD